MAEPLVIVGAGGFGREALDVAEAMNAALSDPRWNILGVVDDAPSRVNLERLQNRGVPYLGQLDSAPEGARLVLAVGAPEKRRELDRGLGKRGFDFATLIHPSALLGSSLSLGSGTIICGGVNVGTNVTLGRQVHLNPCVVIGHDSVIDNFVSVNPSATVSGDCRIGVGTLVGAGAVVLQQLSVGEGAVVGAGAVVTKPVERTRTVKGVPAT